MATELRHNKSPNAAKYENYVAGQLARAEQRIRMLDLTTAVLGFVAATLCYAVLMVVADGQWHFSPLMRQLLFAAYLVAGLVYLGWALVRPLTRRVNPYYAALQLEKATPGTKNSVVNWLDLHEEKLPPAIRVAVGQRAAKDLARSNLEQAISGQRAAWSGGLTALLGFVFVALFILFGPRQFSALLARAFGPFELSNAIPSRTQILILKPEGGDQTVPRGRAITIAVQVEGRIPDPRKPDALKLLWRSPQSGPRPPLALQQQESAREWAVNLTATDVGEEGFFYKITGGDAETPEYRITARSLPAVMDFQAHYHYRPYVGRPDVIRRNRRIEDFRGTEITLVVHTNRAVREGRLTFENMQNQVIREVRAQLVPEDPQALSFHWLLDESGGYRLSFVSTQDETYIDSMLHLIVARPDEPPSEAILDQPGQNISQPVNKLLKLEGKARDDIGVKTLTLQMQLVGGGPLQPKEYRSDKDLRLPSGGYLTDVAYKEAVDLLQIKDANGKPVLLRPDMELEYWLEARDACDYPAPNPAKASQHFRVRILPPENATPQKQKEERDQAKKEQQEHEARQDEQRKQEDQARKDEAKNQGQERKNEKESDNGQKNQGQDSKSGENNKADDGMKSGEDNKSGNDKNPGEGKNPGKDDKEGDDKNPGKEKKQGEDNKGKNDKTPGAENKTGNENNPGNDKKAGNENQAGNEGGKNGEAGKEQQQKDRDLREKAEQLKNALEQNQEKKENQGEQKPGEAKSGEGKAGERSQDNPGQDKKGESKPEGQQGAGKEAGQPKQGEPKAGQESPGQGKEQPKPSPMPGKQGPEGQAKENKPNSQPSGSEAGQAKEEGKPESSPGQGSPEKPGTGDKKEPGATSNRGEAKEAGQDKGMNKQDRAEGKKDGTSPADAKPARAEDKPAGDKKEQVKAEGKPERGPIEPKKARSEDADRLERDLNSNDANKRQQAERDLEKIKEQAQDGKAREAAKKALEKAAEEKKQGEPAQPKPRQPEAKKGEPMPPRTEPCAECKGGADNGQPKPGAGKGSDPARKGEARGESKEQGTQAAKAPPASEPKTPKPEDPPAEKGMNDPNSKGAGKDRGQKVMGNRPGGGGEDGRRDDRGPDESPEGPRRSARPTRPQDQAATELQLEDFKKITPEVLKKAKMSEEELRKFQRDYADWLKRQPKNNSAEKVPAPQAGSSLPSSASGRNYTGPRDLPGNTPTPNRALAPPGYRKAFDEFNLELSKEGIKPPAKVK